VEGAFAIHFNFILNSVLVQTYNYVIFIISKHILILDPIINSYKDTVKKVNSYYLFKDLRLVVGTRQLTYDDHHME